jgi:hypothetical protein
MSINPIESPAINANIDGNKLMPTGEGQSIPNQWQVESTGAYRDVHQLSVYDFMDHTYNGSHGYRDCSYLIPSIREAFYERRRKMSYYVNIFKPIIDAMINPVFNSKVERTHNGDVRCEQFIANCDNAGTALSTFVKNSITTARLNSITFVVVENFPSDMISDDESVNIATRTFPYVYEKTPQEVHEWDCNRQGGLTSITFCDRVEEIDKGKSRHYYRYFDAQNWKEYYIDNPVKGVDNVEVISGEGTHGLGVLPVIPVLNFARSSNLRTLPNPEFYNLAYLCFSLFQKESQVVMGELYQTFSLLYVSNWGKNGLQAGATNFIDCGPDAKFPPGYAAPPQEGLKTVIGNCERLKEEIRNEAQQNGITGLKESQSGLAKQWDFETKAVVLKDTATAAQELEYKIIALVEKYLNTSFGYVANYPTNFEPNTETIRMADMLNIADKLPGTPLFIEAMKELARVMWKNDPDKVEEIIAKIEADLLQKDAIGAMMKEEMNEEEGEEPEDKEREGAK